MRHGIKRNIALLAIGLILASFVIPIASDTGKSDLIVVERFVEITSFETFEQKGFNGGDNIAGQELLDMSFTALSNRTQLFSQPFNSINNVWGEGVSEPTEIHKIEIKITKLSDNNPDTFDMDIRLEIYQGFSTTIYDDAFYSNYNLMLPDVENGLIGSAIIPKSEYTDLEVSESRWLTATFDEQPLILPGQTYFIAAYLDFYGVDSQFVGEHTSDYAWVVSQYGGLDLPEATQTNDMYGFAIDANSDFFFNETDYDENWTSFDDFINITENQNIRPSPCLPCQFNFKVFTKEIIVVEVPGPTPPIEPPTDPEDNATANETTSFLQDNAVIIILVTVVAVAIILMVIISRFS